MSYAVVAYVVSNLLFFTFFGCLLFNLLYRYSLPKDLRMQGLPLGFVVKSCLTILLPSGFVWWLVAQSEADAIATAVAWVWLLRVAVIGFWLMGYWIWQARTIQSLQT